MHIRPPHSGRVAKTICMLVSLLVESPGGLSDRIMGSDQGLWYLHAQVCQPVNEIPNNTLQPQTINTARGYFPASSLIGAVCLPS